MKKYLFIPIALLLLFSSAAFSQVKFSFKLEGCILTSVMKNGDGEITGYSKTTYGERVGDDMNYTIKVTSQYFDKDMNLKSDTSSFEINYVDGELKEENIMELIHNAIKEAAGDKEDGEIDIILEGKPFSVSDDDAVGTKFEEYGFKIKVMGINVGKISFSDISVIAKDVTTISGNEIRRTIVKSAMTAKVLLNKEKTTIKEWYSEGYGVVKTETYNKKGKLDGSIELIAIEKL